MDSSNHSSYSLSGVLVGDDLGQIKRIDVLSRKIVTVGNTALEHDSSKCLASPSVTSITPFDRIDNHHLNSGMFVITNKPNAITLYNSTTNQFTSVRNALVGNETSIVGAQPVSRSVLLVCYENGNINTQNIEKEMLASTETKRKALKLLGLDVFGSADDKEWTTGKANNSSTNAHISSKSDAKADAKAHPKPHPKPSQLANLTASSSQSSSLSSSMSIYSPNWNTANTCITCFKVCENSVAIAGRNVDLKVFDLNTNQNIYTAKSTPRDWLGLRQQVWVSDLDWVGGNSKTNSSPSMIATCSRSDSCVRIYDIKCKQRKAVQTINLKDQTFNNDSNPPSFTSLCATSLPHSKAIPTQNLVLGTTIGRMLAIDLRFNTKTHRLLGVFKGFGGGAVRDIKYVQQSNISFKILSCSLDRFTRIHSFSTSSTSCRDLDAKFYMKTRPTCLQPIYSNFMCAPQLPHIDDDIDFNYD